ncbi:MAG TPA: prephenate dehydratase [Devosia sp.]|jgi:prephenate dehydratase|nr:prephenate dehydratase [Devosia sp.]
MTLRVAFQGEPGAFSHAAAHALFPDGSPVPCLTFEDTLAAVTEGKADFGVVPIENSLYGRITDVHHLLPDSGLFITGEHFLRVEMNLLGLPGTRLEEIEAVQSISVALGQCRKFIQKHRFRTISGVDTAGSAKEVAEKGDRRVAAIASRFAGELYGLDVIAENIEDASHNTTRFLVVSRQRRDAAHNGHRVKTTFVFRVRNVPAALYKALGGFATNGVNMTKLESYMVDGSFTATQFYADIEGHPEDHNVRLALDELGFFTDHLRILGVYPAAPRD